jgi:hypothetical protein
MPDLLPQDQMTPRILLRATVAWKQLIALQSQTAFICLLHIYCYSGVSEMSSTQKRR